MPPKSFATSGSRSILTRPVSGAAAQRHRGTDARLGRVYAARLGDERRTMTACLEAIVSCRRGRGTRFPGPACASATPRRCGRSGWAVTEAPLTSATANKPLAALQGALKMAWHLEMIITDDYLPAAGR